jgi:hypothetical protein
MVDVVGGNETENEGERSRSLYVRADDSGESSKERDFRDIFPRARDPAYYHFALYPFLLPRKYSRTFLRILTIMKVLLNMPFNLNFISVRVISRFGYSYRCTNASEHLNIPSVLLSAMRRFLWLGLAPAPGFLTSVSSVASSLVEPSPQKWKTKPRGENGVQPSRDG